MPPLRPNLRALPPPQLKRPDPLAELLQAIKEAVGESSAESQRLLAQVAEALQSRPDPPSVTVDMSAVRDVLRSLDERMGALQFVGPPALPAVPPPDPDRVAAVLSEAMGTSVEPVFAELLAQLKLLEWRLQPSSSPTLPSHIGINDAAGNKLRIDSEGRITVNSEGGASSTDISDRANRELGVVTVGGTVPVSGPLTDAQLRASSLAVRDDYAAGEILNDQTGAGAVLTFTFAAPRNLVLIQAVGTDQVARADPFGGTPSATQGIRCDDSVPTYLPITTSEVKVFAPSGMVVSVAGFSR